MIDHHQPTAGDIAIALSVAEFRKEVLRDFGEDIEDGFDSQDEENIETLVAALQMLRIMGFELYVENSGGHTNAMLPCFESCHKGGVEPTALVCPRNLRLFLTDKDQFWTTELNVPLDRYLAWKAWLPYCDCSGTTKKGKPCRRGSIQSQGYFDPREFVPGISDRCTLHQEHGA